MLNELEVRKALIIKIKKPVLSDYDAGFIAGLKLVLNNENLILKLDISQDMIKDTLNFFEDSPTDEICPYCSAEVELPPHKGIFECPECGKLIVSCSMCEPNKQNCSNCKLCQLAAKQEE